MPPNLTTFYDGDASVDVSSDASGDVSWDVSCDVSILATILSQFVCQKRILVIICNSIKINYFWKF